MPAQLKNGVIGAKGGKRRGAGDLMGWQKKLCEKLIYDRKLIPRLAECAEGKDIFMKMDMHGKFHKAAADPAIQLAATEKLMDRAWGKPRQEVDVSGVNSVGLSELLMFIDQARQERGLADE